MFWINHFNLPQYNIHDPTMTWFGKVEPCSFYMQQIPESVPNNTCLQFVKLGPGWVDRLVSVS